MNVAKSSPKPSDRAMGMRNLACREVSKIMGASPPKVVRVVSRMGRKRWIAAEWIASWCERPASRSRRLAKSIMISESFTTTPDSATMPNMLGRHRS